VARLRIVERLPTRAQGGRPRDIQARKILNEPGKGRRGYGRNGARFGRV
jgi:hypothetical protein